MSQYMGFDADVATINDMATRELPDVANSVHNGAGMVQNLSLTTTRGVGGQTVDDSGSVFSDSTVHTDLGAKYNAIVQQLHDGLAAIGDSVDTAAQRLKTIADNYERVDQSLAGQ
jgi:type VII secretion effector (TIGR04197 family)